MAKSAPAEQVVPNNPEKRSKVSQTDIPSLSLEDSLRIAQGLWDNYAGRPTAPHDVAIALHISPTSSAWRTLTGSSIAYGLTDGGSNAPVISLTELGKRIVMPTREGDEDIALREAALKPRIPAEFFKNYDRAKLPQDNIAINVLISKGVPKDRATDLVEIIKQNGKFVGFIRDTKSGPFVALDPAPTVVADASANSASIEFGTAQEPLDGEAEKPNAHTIHQLPSLSSPRRVFITHGKDKATMEQIKQVVELGGFEPVVSVQLETAAKPISEKVMDDMRSCGAAVIHVSSEKTLFDKDGEEHVQINPNVLIEIGAAMALYRGRFILVVEDGLKLPSNIQGLYESRYSGNQLTFEAGMKILKALRGLNDNA